MHGVFGKVSICHEIKLNFSPPSPLCPIKNIEVTENTKLEDTMKKIYMKHTANNASF